MRDRSTMPRKSAREFAAKENVLRDIEVRDEGEFLKDDRDTQIPRVTG